MLAETSKKASAEIWVYSIMPNHVHIIVPSDKDGLHRIFADVYRRYAGHINARTKTVPDLAITHFKSVSINLVRWQWLLKLYA